MKLRDSMSFLRGTQRRFGLIGEIIPIPRLAACSATSEEMMLLSHPSSQRPMMVAEALPFEMLMGKEDGLGRLSASILPAVLDKDVLLSDSFLECMLLDGLSSYIPLNLVAFYLSVASGQSLTRR